MAKYNYSTAAKHTTKYMAKAYKRVVLLVRKDTEKDIIDHLEKQESVNSYVKSLIKKDMEAKK